MEVIMRKNNSVNIIEERKSQASHHIPLLIVITLTLAVRVLYAVFFPIGSNHALNADGYAGIAHNLIEGYGYTYPYHLDPNPDAGEPQPNLERGPVPVLMFAGLFKLFGYSALPVMVANWILDVITAVLIFALAFEIFNSRRISTLAGIIFALYIPEVTLTLYAYSETIFMCLMIGFILCLIRVLASPSYIKIILCGILLSLATLSRTPTVLMLFFCFPLMFIYYKKWRTVIKYWCLLCFAFILVIIPWVIRNYVTFNTFIPFTAQTGKNLLASNYFVDKENFMDELDWKAIIDVTTRLYVQHGEVLSGKSPMDVDNFQLVETLKIIAHRPDRFLLLSVYRFLRLWFNVGFNHPPSLQSYMVLVINAFLLLAALAAFLFFRSDWIQKTWPILVMVGYHTILYTLINGMIRYNIPFIPLIFPFTAYTIMMVYDRMKPKLLIQSTQ